MKKLLLIMMLAVVAMSANAQFKSKPIRPETYYITSVDTITVVKDNNIVALTVVVPVGATDSTWIMGRVNTLDGHATAPVFVAPGFSMPVFVSDETRIDTVKIMVYDKAEIILFRSK